MAIAQAVLEGAASLRGLVDTLNRNAVPTRQGKHWKINLVASELARTGNTAKGLRAQATKAYGDEPSDWSEKAFWRFKDAEREVAERNGQWLTAIEHAPKRNDPVRHADHGFGLFDRAEGVILVCRFRPAERPCPQIAVRPIDLEVFVWSITPQRRSEIYAAMRDRILLKSELVKSSSITKEQRRARQRAMRWV